MRKVDGLQSAYVPFPDLLGALSISSSDLGVDSLDEVSASGPLVSFTSLGSDDDDDGKERALRAISATWLLL